MKTLIAALAATALVAAPLGAQAQAHGGGRGGGGFSHASAAGGYHGGGAYRGGGGYRGGGYRGGGYGGYGWRGGYGGGYAPYWGGFGLGLAFGAAAYSPWAYGYYPSYYGYYPAYYDQPPYASSYDEYYDDNYDGDEGPPPAGDAPSVRAPVASSAQAAPTASGQACGQWVWHADQQRYQWAATACGASGY